MDLEKAASSCNSTKKGSSHCLQTAPGKSTSEAPAPSADPHIDTGLLPWLQVLGGHLLTVNSWGYITSYGLFQAHYTETLGVSPSTVSWIGSVQLFLIFFLSTFSMHALTTGYYRHVLAVGIVLQLVGIFTSAEGTQYWHFFLSQSLCQGVGMGLTFAPTVGLVSSYFVKRRAVAIAAIASGLNTGGVIFPLIAQQMLPAQGFKWSQRTMGFVIMLNSVFAVLLLKPKPPPSSNARRIIDMTAFTDRVFVTFAIGLVLAVLGMYFALYYTTPFAEDILHVSSTTSLSLLLTLNAIGLPGRLIPALLADRFYGGLNVLVPVVLCTAILNLAWAGVHSPSGMWTWAIFYGFASASVQTLFPSTLVALTKDKTRVPVRVGMMFTLLSVGCLAGPPLAGALIQAHSGGYLYAQMVMGSIMLLGTAFLVLARFLFAGFVAVKC
ncbi:MFS general substrate transporter [Pseudovirgaria hyperparasitica]|uniref:MFS general substrate transporter n=1 Tax=Pseudovirgaria hyperparasitica TaxID=470096 RepID=A0A6A6W542_9PEZI|nr:MFS general substrate transporter [Pseudovirgaria hyperparasitica]KAF2758048.1 MFS general substrate transporter [Pseudovirgaria hyperparasitica]